MSLNNKINSILDYIHLLEFHNQLLQYFRTTGSISQIKTTIDIDNSFIELISHFLKFDKYDVVSNQPKPFRSILSILFDGLNGKQNSIPHDLFHSFIQGIDFSDLINKNFDHCYRLYLYNRKISVIDKMRYLESIENLTHSFYSLIRGNCSYNEPKLPDFSKIESVNIQNSIQVICHFNHQIYLFYIFCLHCQFSDPETILQTSFFKASENILSTIQSLHHGTLLKVMKLKMNSDSDYLQLFLSFLKKLSNFSWSFDSSNFSSILNFFGRIS